MIHRAVLFDLDGTLVDSAPDIAAALNAALGEARLAPFNLAATTAMVGAGARTLVERALAARGRTNDPALARSVYDGFLRAYDAHPCRETRLYPGVEAALNLLTRDGWSLGVVTNKPEPIASQVLDVLGLAPHFGALAGGRDGVPLKPAPDMILRALQALGAGAERSVFVGDSKADLEAGHAAGLPVVLVSHGYSAVSAARLGAQACIAHFDEMAGAIARVSSNPSPQTA